MKAKSADELIALAKENGWELTEEGAKAYFEHCVGGCRAIALTLTGDKLGIDPSKCLFFKKGYYEKTVAVMEGWKNLSEISV